MSQAMDTELCRLPEVKGTGALTVTDPPGAEVVLHRYETRNRRLVASAYLPSWANWDRGGRLARGVPGRASPQR